MERGQGEEGEDLEERMGGGEAGRGWVSRDGGS